MRTRFKRLKLSFSYLLLGDMKPDNVHAHLRDVQSKIA